MKQPALSIVVIVALVALAAPASAGTLTAEAVFDQLKDLAGTWQGMTEGEGEAAEAPSEVTHRIEVSAGGTVVMETMQPETDHEMINMYHLDGDDLLLTHYCAGGNQPRMKLDLAASNDQKLVFDFVGGTNLDPSVDGHIHAAEIQMIDGDHMDSIWQGWSEGKHQGTMTFHLARID